MNEYYNKQKINTIIVRWLVIIMVIVLIAATTVGLILQDNFQKQRSFSVIRDYLTDYVEKIDVGNAINTYCNEWMEYAIDGEDAEGKETYFDNGRLARTVTNNSALLSELCIVNKEGIISYSSNSGLINTDLRASEHMGQFLCLLEGETSFSDTFYPAPFTDTLKMAYIGKAFRDGSGAVLFGINEDAYENWWQEEIYEKTTDLRIGVTGYLINCDTEKNVNCATHTMEDEVGDAFLRDDLLPAKTGEIKETITELFGKECYVAAIMEDDYYIIGAYPMVEADQFEKQNNILFVGLFIMIFAAFFAAIFIMLKRLVIEDVEETHATLRRITEGNLEERVVAAGSLEFFELSMGINDMVAKLKSLIAAENIRVHRVLENARQIQTGAVPGIFPPFPEDKRFGLFATMDTAMAVGGDFYDFFMTDDNTLWVVMADVSGKGMPAALYMMRAKTLIKTYAEQGLAVDEVAVRANRELCEDREAEMFVTAWIGALDLDTGVISYVHAGHTLPVLISNGSKHLAVTDEGEAEALAGTDEGETEPPVAETKTSISVTTVKQKINMVLGGLKKAKYLKQEITLKPGDCVFLYTDGVSEARAVSGDMYGEERLMQLMEEKFMSIKASDRNDHCEAVCRLVLDDVKKFAFGAEQYDDITIMCLRYVGKN